MSLKLLKNYIIFRVVVRHRLVGQKILSLSKNNNSKVIIDMAAYEDFNPQTTHKTTAEAKQAYVNFVTSAVTGTAGSDTTFALSIVGLQSLGYDPQQLYPLGSSTPLDLVAELNGVTHSESAWNAPYVLAAYNQGDYGTDS